MLTTSFPIGTFQSLLLTRHTSVIYSSFFFIQVCSSNTGALLAGVYEHFKHKELSFDCADCVYAITKSFKVI